MEELYRALYSKYAGNLSQEEVNTKIGYALEQDPNDFINAFYQKYTGNNPTQNQANYIKNYLSNINKLQVDKEELSDSEQFSNVFKNAGLGLQEAWESTKIAGAQFGSYLGVGDDKKIDEYIVNQYKKLDEISSKMGDTGKGIVGGIKEGDIADVGIGVVNALTSVITTVAPAVLTRGMSLAPQIMAPMYTEYNSEKAKALYGDDSEESIEKLLKNNEDEVAIPMALGVAAVGLERIGIKGISRYVLNNTRTKGAKRIADLTLTGNKEGLTEYFQGGLNVANKSLAQGDDAKTVSKKVFDHMSSEDALEEYVQGFVGGTGVSAGSAKINSAFRDKNDNIIVNDYINALGVLNQQKVNSKTEKAKKAIDKKIEKIENNFKDFLIYNQKTSEYLTEEQATEAINILDSKKELNIKLQDTNNQLKNGEINKNEYDLILEDIKNEFDTNDKKLNDIKVEANKKLLHDDLRVSSKAISKIKGLSQRVYKTPEGFLKALNARSKKQYTLKQIENIDGLVVDKDILINETVAAESNAITVGSHELLHAIVKSSITGETRKVKDIDGKTVETDLTVEGAVLIKDFLNELSSKENKIVQKRIDDNYRYNRNKKGEIVSEKAFEQYAEEYLNAYADAAIKNELSDSLLNKLGKFLQKIFNKGDKGYQDLSFKTGKDVKTFLKAYVSDRKKGEFRQQFVGMAQEGVKQKTKNTIIKKSITAEQKAQVKADVDQLGDGKTMTQEQWDSQMKSFAQQQIQDEKLLDNLIAAQYKADVVPVDFVKKVYSELTRDFNRFKVAEYNEDGSRKTDADGKPIGNDSLFGFLNSIIGKRAGDVYNREYKKKPQEKTAKRISDVTKEGEPTIQIAAEPTADFDVKTETKPIPKSQRRRELKDLSDIDLNNTDIISKNTYNKLEEIIERNPDNIEEEITNLIEKDVSKEVKKEMGKISKKGKDVEISPEYDSFLSLGFDGIVNSLDVNTIKKQYGKLFKIKKKAREKDKKIDPVTGKATYPGKGIYDITMPKKAEFIKYFTEGGYTTLLAKQKTLAKLIADSFVKKASQKYITNNTKDLDTAIKSELERWIDFREKQKDENKSFDNIKFSKSLRDLTIDEQVVFWNRLGEASTSMNPALKNLLDWKNVKIVLDNVYNKDISSKKLTAIAKDFVKLLEIYQPTISKNKTIDETRWTEFVADSFMEEANNVVKMLNLEINGKPVKSAASIYDNIKNIEQGRRVFVDIGNMLIKKYGPKKAAKQIAILKGMYANNAKVGRGMFKTDMKTLKVIPVKLKKGEKFGSPRNQIFENVPVFDAYVNKLEGKNQAETEAFQKAYKETKPLFNQDSKSAIKDKNYKGRLEEAQEAREIIDDVMSMLDNDLDIAMFMISNLSSMKTPLRRAANLRYIADEVLKMDINKVGKLAEYEHMIPASYMALKIIDVYKNKGGIKNLNDFYKNYNVAIIPKTMDVVLKQQGLQNKMLAGYNFQKDPSTDRYYNFLTAGMKAVVPIRDINNGKLVGIKFSKSVKNTKTLDTAIKFSRSAKNESKGITVLDFDDTLATTKSLVKFTRPDGTTGTLNAEEYASKYEDLLDQGYTFDFSDFNKVVKGKLAPLFNKAMKLQSKFGPENMFVLTARPPAAQKAIFDFLKANGLNIPLKNITGLGNSTAEAKALWIADKVGEGYNDFYFADDALQNVQAVKNMLDQFDVKSKVQQAKVKFSKSMNKDFNDILENITGIESKKRFSAIKARKRGESKGKFRFFIPPSHEDFVGLLYNFIGKGKEGNKHRDFFEQALIRPLNRAYRELNTAKQSIANDYKSLNKQFADVKKKLIKKTPDGDFTYQDAIRVYLWDKHGHDISGLSETDQQSLVDLVNNDQELRQYAETLNIISKQDKYVAPTESWEAGDIRTDLDDATGRIGRAEFFSEFLENVETIFSQENLNKIEAAYGADVVSAIKDMLYRIKTGQNRPSGQNKLVNKFLNYLNGSVASTMFFNIRSAVLQQMSMVNFINFADNNIIAAAKAFANQKQYWTDWATIFNSDFMKQRRKGIQTDVNGAELAASVKNSKNPIQAAIKKLLELGFLPTQIGDNIAIATGGATFLRNRINTYLKQGLNQKEAEAKAFVDFEILAEATQQSARPDMVSQQQASPLGKVILAFQNVTSQFNRLGKKAFLDIKNRRITPGNQTQLQSDASNLSRIAYYFAIQNLIFYSLQSALFMMMFDDDEEDERWLKKKERMIDGSIDSVLRGTGVWGAAIATLKNMAKKWHEQRDKSWNKDESAVLMEMLNVSPPLGIKARKLVNAEKTLNYKKKTIDEMETFDIDNPMWSAVTSYTEAITNVPLNRLYNKTQNVRESLDNQHSALERALMFGGWSKWNLGIEDVEKSKKKEKFSGKKKTKARGTLKVY